MALFIDLRAAFGTLKYFDENNKRKKDQRRIRNDKKISDKGGRDNMEDKKQGENRRRILVSKKN